MPEMTEEEKYARKAAMLKRALAAADEMDKADEKKAASVKADNKAKKEQDKQAADEQAQKDSAPQPMS